jgi:hypothetical protein
MFLAETQRYVAERVGFEPVQMPAITCAIPDACSLLLGPHGHVMFLRPDGLTCPKAPRGANVVRQREPWADPMDTNRLLIIVAAVVLALVLVWYLLPRSTPTAPTATPPPATTPAQPQQ